MSGILVALPLQLACQLLTPGNHSDQSYNVVTDSLPLPQPTELPEGYTRFPDIGVAYNFYSNNMTWNSARKHCISEGGNLAVIDSFKKIAYARSLSKSDTRPPFTGIHSLYGDREWISVKTGLPLPFIPWIPRIKLSTENAPCTVMEHVGPMGINKAYCNVTWAYLCEIPLFQDYRCQHPQIRITDTPLSHERSQPIDQTFIEVH